MTLRLHQIRLDLDDSEDSLPHKAAATLGIQADAISSWRLVRRSLDARKKPRIQRVYTIDLEVSDERSLLSRRADLPHLVSATAIAPWPLIRTHNPRRVLVVGMGPAGLFAALRLAHAGAQVTLIDRGQPVERRSRDVQQFWRRGVLDPESNLQFGEGGAGTFSDGKLSTRIHHPGVRHVLETLVACGAPASILVDAKPHLGTDRLGRVIRGMRSRLEEAGVEIRYATRLSGLEVGRDGVVRGGVLDDRDVSAADAVVLATGHSARDTYAALERAGVALAPKAFAVGLRVEHPAALIHRIQYARGPHPFLPPAEYSLAWTDRATGRAVYSFCMCPGGEVVIAASEAQHLAVNGMSRSLRDGERSNAALVVSVRPDDFDPAAGPLAGIAFQRRAERAAYAAGGECYHAPAQSLLAFLGRTTGGPLRATTRPGIREADLAALLPSFVTDAIRKAIPRFDRKMRGFVTREAVLLGVETRTSAPVRILRGEDGQSVSHPGLFPAGEGAGYAGGIVSSAVDGLRQADLVCSRILRTHLSSSP